MIRVLVAFFIVVSAVIAIMQYYSANAFIAQLMGISWGALAGAFLAPFLYGLVHEARDARGGLDELHSRSRAHRLEYVPVSSIASPINAGAIAMVLGLILVPIVSLFTPKPAPSTWTVIFHRYEQPVTVSAKTSIEDED